MSGIGVYYPDGRETQRVGIIPDVFINQTRLGIINSSDEYIDAAINYIKD